MFQASALPSILRIPECIGGLLNPDYAVGVVARRRKPLRNAQKERFWPAGIFINMLRTKFVKSRLGGIAWIFKPQ